MRIIIEQKRGTGIIGTTLSCQFVDIQRGESRRLLRSRRTTKTISCNWLAAGCLEGRSWGKREGTAQIDAKGEKQQKEKRSDQHLRGRKMDGRLLLLR